MTIRSSIVAMTKSRFIVLLKIDYAKLTNFLQKPIHISAFLLVMQLICAKKISNRGVAYINIGNVEKKIRKYFVVSKSWSNFE